MIKHVHILYTCICFSVFSDLVYFLKLYLVTLGPIVAAAASHYLSCRRGGAVAGTHGDWLQRNPKPNGQR